MFFLVVFILAILMAVFGIIGHQKGTLVMAIALAILFGAFLATELFPEEVISLMNTLYRLTVAMFSGGLGAFVSGDLEGFFEVFEAVDAPFTGSSSDLALLVVVGSAALIGFLLMALLKAKPSVGGAVLGIAYGYLLSAAALPVIFNVPSGFLPVPPFRALDPTGFSAPVQQQGPTSGGFVEALTQPGTVQLMALVIAVGMALILILSARGSRKRG